MWNYSQETFEGIRSLKMLSKRYVTLNIPPFQSFKRRFSGSEIRETEQIVRLRIHVERMNKRIKENDLFDSAIPMSVMTIISIKL
jgi:hypothetical protein